MPGYESHDENHDRALQHEERELIPGTASTRSIAHTVVVKDEDAFFLSEPDGSVPLEAGHGLGLYYHDCRYLSGYELRLAGEKPEQLVCTAERGFMAVLGLTNPQINISGADAIQQHSIEIRWERLIDSERLAVFDSIKFHNLQSRPLDFTFSLTFKSEFDDVFAVRGATPEKRGRLHQPAWKDGSLRFAYDGADGIHRGLCVYFSMPFANATDATAHFHLSLQPKHSKQLHVSLVMMESFEPGKSQALTLPHLDLRRVESSLRAHSEEFLESETRVRSDSLLLNRIMDRSLRDLSILRSHLAGEEYFAAGVPWFVALFGRDSIITALQTLAYDPGIAEQTLRLLAKYQGKQIDQWREEEPGKILHELRVGEMARLDEIPQTPYYGTIDATPLFLVLLACHADWTGELNVFNDLRNNVEAALDWISNCGDLDGDGYVEYRGNPRKGLLNQGWKDSGDAVINVDGTLAAPPIALVEVQGYVYRAKAMLADLYDRAGESARADGLRKQAQELRHRFNRDFWVERGFYALALQDGNRPAAVMSSNAGHALWAGIADSHKATATAERLMADDMFNGWGIRTLSEKELNYNPLGYHLGTVWPHDNSLIVAGLRRYGCDEAALRVFVGMVEASLHFSAHRLPELFGGFHKVDYGVPVNYPVACQPQAWAAGAMPYMLKVLLGFAPEAFEKRLRIIRPMLPDFVNQVEIGGLRVGAARLDLIFERKRGRIIPRVLNIEGELEVVVEQ